MERTDHGLQVRAPGHEAAVVHRTVCEARRLQPEPWTTRRSESEGTSICMYSLKSLTGPGGMTIVKTCVAL
jgi:hypothetical protein